MKRHSWMRDGMRTQFVDFPHEHNDPIDYMRWKCHACDSHIDIESGWGDKAPTDKQVELDGISLDCNEELVRQVMDS